MTNDHTRGTSSLAWAVLGSAALVSVAAPAHAFDAAVAAKPAVAADPASDPQVEGITVTGNRPITDPLSSKFTAPLLDTPKSVVIIDQAVIQATGSLTLQDALRTTPGITFGSGEGGTSAGDRPLIRGVESTNDIFVDGVRDAGTQSRDVFAVDSIQVVKGPGSAFSGRGTTGGAINIVTKVARQGEFANVGVIGGTDPLVRLTGDFNKEVAPGVAVRLAAMYQDADVAGRDAVTEERWGVAPSVSVGLGSGRRALFSYYHLSTDGIPDYGVPFDPRTLKPVRGHDSDFYGLTARDFRKTEADIGTFRFEQDLPLGLKFANTFRYGTTSNRYVVTNPDDSRGNVPNGFVFRSQKNRNVETETIADVPELRGDFRTGSFKHSFTLGGEFSEENTHNQGYVVSGPGLAQAVGSPPVAAAGRVDGAVATALATSCSRPGGGLGAAFGYNCTTLSGPNPDDPWIGTVARSPAFTDVRTRVAAGWFFDTVEIVPQLLVNFGVRYDDFQTRATGFTAVVAPTAPFYTLTRAVPAENRSSFWNYQAGVVYKPTPDGSIYFGYGTSSNPSGEGVGDFSTVAVNTQNLAPEDNESYEAGVKWQLFDQQLNVTGAVFRTDKSNARVTDALGNPALIGSTRYDGVEASFSGNLRPGWTLFGGYTYLDAKIVNGGLVLGGAQAATTGKRVPNAPKHAFTIFTTYDVTPRLNIGGGAQYQSERFADAANTRRVDEYWRVDAVASYKLSRKATLQLNLQNLADERYALQPYTTHMVQLAPGRSARISVNYAF